MTALEIDAFFKAYAGAFSRLAVDEICNKWAYPAYFVANGRRASLTEDAFRVNTEALCRFYQARGVALAEKQVLEISRLAASTVSVRTADTLSSADGGKIAAWEHVYLVSDTENGPRVVTAMADAELAAWRALERDEKKWIPVFRPHPAPTKET